MPAVSLHALCLTLVSPLAALAQTGHPVEALPPTLPPGLTLPIHLEHPIRSGRTAPGAAIRARLTQRVPLGAESFLPTSTELLGTVVASTRTSLTLRFDQLSLNGQTIPITTEPVALASFVAVNETAVPCAGAVDRANPDAANWTTCQVGGDQVVRSGWSGPVLNDRTQTVGFADFNGVYASPVTPDALPHALGAFSPGARGLFGYGTGASLHSTFGAFTLRAARPITLHVEDNLLLVASPPENAKTQSSALETQN